MKIRKRFWGQSIMIGLFVSFLVFSIITSFVFQIRKAKEYRAEIIEINNQIKNTKEEISKLEKTSGDNLEKLAREELGMIKQNEIIYMNSDERDN
ncbi:MAG: FtsB family cell division protein [Romboutsia sp.]|uniref:FtsB family cell division protein n=1 Tax=Romboutsia sp. TaxID=1965302 RepID=UPI003F40A57A